jgi:hypothetical protein
MRQHEGSSFGRLVLVRALALVMSVAACASSHRAEPVVRPDDTRLKVGLKLARSHERPLRDGASAGLARMPFAVLLPSSQGGEVELQLDIAQLAVVGHETLCGIKILVMRLPQRDLVGLAEGNARAGGTHAQAASDCISQLGQSLISGKVRPLLQQLHADR